jgi:predicted transcriptional regulator
MATTSKTTVYLDDASYEQLKEIARAEGRSPALLVREAVAEYAARKRPNRVPRCIGVGHSGRGDVAERAEELLAGMGRRR